MIIEQRTVYRCGFCRRCTKFQARWIAKHEVHCGKNPNRKPFIGELTFANATGLWMPNKTPPLPGFDSEYVWQPYDKQPPWWPGSAGMIYAADGWQPVPGYVASTGVYEDEKWPVVNGKNLDQIKPFWRRVHALGMELDDKHQEWVNEGYEGQAWS